MSPGVDLEARQFTVALATSMQAMLEAIHPRGQ